VPSITYAFVPAKCPMLPADRACYGTVAGYLLQALHNSGTGVCYGCYGIVAGGVM
jgi:hypothetical protein